MSHISKTPHAISMNLSLNVIHDSWTQKMQKGENIFFPHLDPFSQYDN
jgi:iron-sulfur cluster repair protein YtfE (RIC family)